MEILIQISILLITFRALAIICDQLFVPSLERIAEKLKMSSEFAGATLMAIGSSAPELFTSIFAVTNSSIGIGIGAGTIVGSALFNILVIIGAAAIVKNIKIGRKPVIRDLFFYCLSIGLLLLVFRDGKIVLREAMLFVFIYIIYVRIAKNRGKRLKYHVPLVYIESKEKRLSKLINIFIPKNFKYRNSSIFILSILLIALFTHLMVEAGVGFAHNIGLSPIIIGLTILAAGTSIPDLISSIIAARKGEGDMAITNAIGSNIFDILFGLGAPYLLFFLLYNEEYIKVGNENLEGSIFLLGATVLSVLFILLIKKRNLSRRTGIVLILLYLIYLIRNIALSFN